MIDSLDDPVPLTGGWIDHWSAGLAPRQAGCALVAAGLTPEGIEQLGSPGLEAMFLRWNADLVTLRRSPRRLVSAATSRLLREPPPDVPFRQRLLRLELRGNHIPSEVIPRLYEAPAVASAVIPVSRPPGSLRRKSLRWPIRVGIQPSVRPGDLTNQILTTDLPAGAGRTHRLPPLLVDVQVIDRPGMDVDVLVLTLPLPESQAFAEEFRPTASAVVVLDTPAQSWPLIEAALSVVRAVTGAFVCALGPRLPKQDGHAELARILGLFLAAMSHSHPLDTSLTIALARKLFLVGETAALLRTDLATNASHYAQAIRGMTVLPPFGATIGPIPTELTSELGQLDPARWGREISPSGQRRFQEMVGSLADRLNGLAQGEFHGERHEASSIPEVLQDLDNLAEAASGPRFLQAAVGPTGGGNVIREGPNRIRAFIGPRESGFLSGPRIRNSDIGFISPEITSVRLTLVLVPLVPRGPVSRTELDVPRLGRSPDARLLLHVPKGAKRVEARLTVLHRNRVVQTAVLKGTVDGQPAQLTQVIVVRPKLERLNSQSRFDTAFVLNHDSTGASALIRHADGHTWIESMGEIDAITTRIRDHLLTGAFMKPVGKTGDKKLRRLLVDLALEGNDLFNTLEDNLGELSHGSDPRRIQIVTARSGRFLPLEFIYPRVAPADDAALCARWTAGDQCGPGCFADDDDNSIICPSVFWGMSRTIERHYVEMTTVGPRFLVLADPDTKRKDLTLHQAMFGASTKVPTSNAAATVRLLGTGARQVNTWEEWARYLAATPTDLLVLLPHSDPKTPSLEISTNVLRRARIEARHVTGGNDVEPVVVLFGCDTAGTAEDPAGFATRFMQKHAAVVFSTLTMVYAPHAASLAQRLVTLLRDEARQETTLGELVTQFRREAFREGLVAALAVTAYGDADWRI